MISVSFGSADTVHLIQSKQICKTKIADQMQNVNKYTIISLEHRCENFSLDTKWRLACRSAHCFIFIAFAQELRECVCEMAFYIHISLVRKFALSPPGLISFN